MVYWIDDNGEKLGPMRAIDVLRRARTTTRIFDGETWFQLDEVDDLGGAAGPDTQTRESERGVIRKIAI